MTDQPSISDIRAARDRLRGRIVATPTLTLSNARIAPHLPDGDEAVLKLELFQRAGSFKARGALLSLDALSPDERARAVAAISAGNHALAVA